MTRYLGRNLITPDDLKMVQVNHSFLALAFFVGLVRGLSLVYILQMIRWISTPLYYRGHGNIKSPQNPFLMHASKAVAFAYDRHLTQSLNCRLSVEECYHRSRSLAILNERLHEPIEIRGKDAIWRTAAAFAVLSFSTLMPLHLKTRGLSNLLNSRI